MTNFRKMLDEIEAHRASLPPEVRAKLEAAMDVHDLARAKSAIAWLFFDRRYTNVCEGVFYSPEQLSSGQMERVDMVWDEILPLIEAHTRAAVEAERARCLAIVEPPLMHRKGRIGLWRQRRAEMADAIRKAKP
jgi:hypothetical protein